jgi:hypothetical protein
VEPTGQNVHVGSKTSNGAAQTASTIVRKPAKCGQMPKAALRLWIIAALRCLCPLSIVHFLGFATGSSPSENEKI